MTSPLGADEQARAELNFVPYVAESLATSGRFRVSVDTPDRVQLFQRVARRVGDMLQRPVVSHTNGRYITITFGQEDPSPQGSFEAARPAGQADQRLHRWTSREAQGRDD